MRPVDTAWMLSCAAVLGLSGCDSRESSEPAVELSTARVFGFELSHVQGSGPPPRLARCAGRQGLLVPPAGTLQTPVHRGAHTLRGRAALCDDHGPADFEIALGSLDQARQLLAIRVPDAAERTRSAEPFALTFWSDDDGVLRLTTKAESKAALPAWLDLRLELGPNLGRAAVRPRQASMSLNERGAIWLTDWGWSESSSGWGPLEIDRNNGTDAPNDGGPIVIGGERYPRGIGMHAPAALAVQLGGACQRLRAEVGTDDAAGPAGSVVFQVWNDEHLLWESPVKRAGERASALDLDVRRLDRLRLVITTGPDGPEGDWGNWANPELVCNQGLATDTAPGRRARRHPLVRNERGAIWLSDWGWEAGSNSWGPIEIDGCNGGEQAEDGTQLTIGGKTYQRGIGVHPPSLLVLRLDGACQRLRAQVGVDDAVAPNGSVVFHVWSNDQQLWSSPVKRGAEPATPLDLDLTGRAWVQLVADNGPDGPENDWADWADAELVCDDPR
jgi:hypothetical protein